MKWVKIKRVLKALMTPYFLSIILFFISIVLQKYLLALIFVVIFVITNIIFFKTKKDKILLYYILSSKVLGPEDIKGVVSNSDEILKKLIEQGMVEVKDNKIILLKERYKVFNQVFWRKGNGNTKPNYSSYN